MSRRLPFLIILIATPVFAAPPTDVEIQEAIRDLGDKRFAARKRRASFLMAASASRGSKTLRRPYDPETARRARDIRPLRPGRSSGHACWWSI